MYPIKNHLLNSITYDENGAYTQRWTTKTKYFVIRRSNSTEIKAQIVHKNDKGEYFSKQRDGRSYTDVYTAASDMYTVERYYHPNKSILSVGNLVVQVRQVKRTNYRPHLLQIKRNITKVILSYNHMASFKWR